MRKTDSAERGYQAIEETRRSNKKITLRECVEYTICFLVALPSATLNGVAALSNRDDNLGNVHSPAELMQFITNHSNFAHDLYALSVFTLSSMVFFFLNQRYLFPSLYRSATLLLNTTKMILNKISCGNFFPVHQAPSLMHVLFFTWSFLTSLVFAELGGKAFSFLYTPGIIVGFCLTLLVYFSTRYASAAFTWDNFNNINESCKNKYFNKLLQYSLSDITDATQVDMGDSKKRANNVSIALAQWLMHVTRQRPSTARHVAFQYIVPLCSVLAISITAIPIMAGFIPDCIQGIERLLQIDLNQQSQYQNFTCILIGLLATSMTMVFYEISIRSLPKQLIMTCFSFWRQFQNTQYSPALQQLALTSLAFFASTVTSIGFKFAVTSAVENGYLSYLGNTLSAMLPNCVFAAVTMMLWSHLQELVNNYTTDSNLTDLSTITEIHAGNVMALLKHSEINLQPELANLSAQHYSLFRPAHEIDIDISDSENQYKV
ncbi:MAG: hypothetical protein A3F10_04170 [Coxiella sp. RIFCSPHIGHO2_12_FULL_42_15]|nr:MAG: hypothetical protein A3F10_04170 [Coxiella sp. RIFCSPHIGHO2_12_FULL_42_15]